MKQIPEGMWYKELVQCFVEHHAQGKHTVSMLQIYGSGWKEPIVWFGTNYIKQCNTRSSAMTGIGW